MMRHALPAGAGACGRALGAGETLSGVFVALVGEGMQPLRPVIGTLGAVGAGPSATVAEDAPLQTRLLDATGRRP